MNKSIRHTAGFSCAPGSGFFARCPKDGRLLIFGQTCVCGTNSAHPNPRPNQARYIPQYGAWVADHAPRSACSDCFFEYPLGGSHVCR